MTLAFLILLPMLVATVYTWRIVQAIDDAQDVVVVDLPTSKITPPGKNQSVGQNTSTPMVASNDGATPETQALQLEPTPASQSSTSNPSQFDIARGVLGAGTGVDAPDPGDVWPGKQTLNILLLGVDKRPDGGDQNADVIIVARLNLESGEMSAVSLPRDLLVEIPDHGTGKINGAYNIGVKENPDDKAAGVAKVRDTIEYNFGIPIDEYVLVDFNGFEKVVDSVGGIEVNVPVAIDDKEYPTEDYGVRELIIPAGPQHMDGETALAYARTRHGDSDDERRERQQLVLLALFDKAQNIGSLTKASKVVSALGGAVQTSLHFNEQMTLASIALHTDRSEISQTSVAAPLIEPGETEDGQWVYVGDANAIAAFMEETLAIADAPATESSTP